MSTTVKGSVRLGSERLLPCAERFTILAMTLPRVLALGLCLGTPCSVSADLAEATRSALSSEDYVYVATRRDGGDWSEASPIWFWWDGSRLYFTTGPDTWKTKRIRRGSPVRISVGAEDGPSFEGDARIFEDRETVERIGKGYADKYWIAWLGLFRPRVSRVESGKTVAVEVVPRID